MCIIYLLFDREHTMRKRSRSYKLIGCCYSDSLTLLPLRLISKNFLLWNEDRPLNLHGGSPRPLAEAIR